MYMYTICKRKGASEGKVCGSRRAAAKSSHSSITSVQCFKLAVMESILETGFNLL